MMRHWTCKVVLIVILMGEGILSQDSSPTGGGTNVTTPVEQSTTTVTAASSSVSTTKPTTTITQPPTTTTPPPTTTTTTTQPTTTTEAPAMIGSPCNTDQWCKNSIKGDVICDTNCTCNKNFFQANPTACLNESLLQPNITELSANTTTITFKIELDGHVSGLSLTNTAESASPGGDVKPCRNEGLTFVCESLLPGTQYNLTVDVRFGNAQKSASSYGFTVPVPPTNVSVTSLETSAVLNWAPSDGSVDYYVAQLVNKNQVYNTSGTNATFFNLTSATNYTVELKAYSNGNESRIKTVTFKTLSGVPDPPTNLQLTLISHDATTFSWNAPVNPNGPIENYEVCRRYKVYNDSTYLSGSCENTTIQHKGISNLTAGTFYVFTAYTVNDRYKSAVSEELHVRTNQTEPGKVDNLSVQPGNRSLNVSWSRPIHPNGDILAYRLQWKMSDETEYECSVILKTAAFTESGNYTCKSNHTSKNITVNQKTLLYEIHGLKDYQIYNVSVTAYTSIGPGDKITVDQQTSIAKPEPVSNVTVGNITSTSALVQWTLPNDNPGPVTYIVQIKDLVNNTEWGSVDNCKFEGKNWTSCTVINLHEFWMYRIRVKAYTEAGNVFSENQTLITLEADPGAVLSVVVSEVAGACDATSIFLEWTEPTLEERKSNIAKYIVDCDRNTNDQRVRWEHSVSNPDPYKNTNRVFKEILKERFQAESSYFCEIYAVSSTHLNGTNKNFTVETKSCSPPSWDSGGYEAIRSHGQGTSSIKVTYPAKFFGNSKQGSIKETGFCVKKEKGQLSSVNFKDLVNWNNAKQKDFRIPYKIVISPNQHSRGRRNVPEAMQQQNADYFEIGTNSSCSSNVDPNYYCNGPLPSDVPFYVTAYACSGAGCTPSKEFGPFRTSAPPSDSGSSGWIVAVVVLSIIAVLLLSVVALMYFKGIDPRGWLRNDQPKSVPDKLDGELDNVITTADIPRRRPLSLAKYDEELDSLRRDTNLKFSDQYVDLAKLSEQITKESSIEAAILEPNKAKNRWVNILPYDHSRVKLQQLDEDDPSSDYINANYIPGYNTRREYIATQGPLPGTVDDFWRMVWEHNVQMIVMLTQCKEGNRVKCEMYWPDVVKEPKQYGDVVVNPISKSTLSKYNITIFDVSVNNQHRQVFHFHYLHFPDFSANVEFDVFIEFVQIVRSHLPHDMAGPIVVHCSAGVGRTGTFIGVDRLDQYLRSENFSFDDTVDIFNMVMSMRENRVMMVQTESQYIMIHDCLKLLLEAKKQAMEADSDENLYANDGFDPYPEVLYENVDVRGEPKTEL